VVPWNTVRGAEAWERAEPLTLFYVGSKFGRNEPFGSLRLKAFRRGQQDVEYLTLLAKHRGWDHESVSTAVSGELDLAGAYRQNQDEDAGSVSFEGVTNSQIEAVRRRVVRALAHN
jgi:hypothetical protein